MLVGGVLPCPGDSARGQRLARRPRPSRKSRPCFTRSFGWTPSGSADNLALRAPECRFKRRSTTSIEDNGTLGEFLKGFPSVTREQAIQFIELAKETCCRAYP